jgi:tetratricopeptide (TPR) repeat protein
VPDWLPLPKKAKAAWASSEASKSAGTAFESGSSGLQLVDRLLSQQQFDVAERTLSGIADPKQRAAGMLRLAKGLLMGGRVDRARQILDRCLAEEPMLIEGQLLKASFAEEAGDLPQAEQAYRRALYSDRNCPMAHFHLGLLLKQKGDALGSNRSFKTTLKLIENQNPHDLVQYGEGVCYGRLKEMLQMIVCF